MIEASSLNGWRMNHALLVPNYTTYTEIATLDDRCFTSGPALLVCTNHNLSHSHHLKRGTFQSILTSAVDVDDDEGKAANLQGDSVLEACSFVVTKGYKGRI